MSDWRYVVNVEAFIAAGDRFLIVTRGADEAHAPNALSVPGGKVEGASAYEDVLEATLRREVLEEVGVALAADVVYVESKLFVTDDGQPCLDVVFLCSLAEGAVPRAASVAEVGDLRWMTADEVVRDPRTPPWTKRSITLAERRRVAPSHPSPGCPG